MKASLVLAAMTCALMSVGAAADDNGITYKGVNIQLGGFLASETVMRNNNMSSDIGTNFSAIPFANDKGYGMSEFRGTERQSRFSLLATGNVDDNTVLSGYYELDFLGTTPTANYNESTSYAPRTRHVYMNIDWNDSGWHLLAGQTWSLVTLDGKGITPRSEVTPLTIDAQYAVGFNWARQWQLRMVKDFSKEYWIGLSLENGQTTIAKNSAGGTGNTNNEAGSGTNWGGTNYSFNAYPDVVAKFAADPGFGHYEVYGLARNFQSRYGTGGLSTQTNKQSVWTEAVGFGVIVPVVPQMVDLYASGLFGKGIGRYGTTGLGDATYAADNSLAPLNGSDWLVQATWHAGTGLDVYATYGMETVSSKIDGTAGYGDGIVATDAGCSTLGGTCNPNIKDASQINVGLWWSFYKGNYGAAKLGAQYSHTQLETFADATGFAPKTTEDMIFSSLRFYPF